MQANVSRPVEAWPGPQVRLYRCPSFPITRERTHTKARACGARLTPKGTALMNNEETTYPSIVTAPMVLAHNRLFTAELDKVRRGFPKRYEAILLVEDDDQLTPIEAALAEASADHWPDGTPENLRLPIFEDGKRKGYPTARYVRVTTGANQPPVLANPNGSILDMDAKRTKSFYAGALAVAQVVPRPYVVDTDDKGEIEGVSLDLEGLRIVNADRKAYPVLSFRKQRKVSDAFLGIEATAGRTVVEPEADDEPDDIQDDLDF